jgi:hypothetical protein
MFDLENHEISEYNIILESHIRDYDTNDSDSDWGIGSTTINGNQTYGYSLNQFEVVEANNMKFLVYYKIEPGTLNDYCSYKPGDSVCIPTTPNPN